MSAIRPSTPVIVGVAQQTWHASPTTLSPEPAEMMAGVLVAAAEDAGDMRLIGRATGLWTVDVASWGYPSAPAAVAQSLGIDPQDQRQSVLGGEQPQVLIGAAAEAIAFGIHDVVLIAGAEAFRTRRIARANGIRLDWSPPGRTREAFAPDRDPCHPAEKSVGALMPLDFYPLFEQALRGSSGRSLSEHQSVIGELWADFARVAAQNPHAVSRNAPAASEIATASAANRMVAFPYTKLLTSNIWVDQAACVIVCSAGTAESLGLPRHRWIFPLASAAASDPWFVSDRERLDESPALRASAAAVLSAAGINLDQVAHLDLYSCFPSAVQIARGALGIASDDKRPLTQTGGLTFAGGPGNNYSMHGMASLAERLRTDPGSFGLLTANGMFSTKHAVGLYGTEPPAEGFGLATPAFNSPGRLTDEGYSGRATVESWTVRHDDQGVPTNGIVVGRTAAGHRVWAGTREPDTLVEMEAIDLLGSEFLIADGTAHLT